MITITVEVDSVVRLLLVACRITGALLLAPLVGSERLPARVKIVFALALSLLISPTLPRPELHPGAWLAAAAMGELALGLGLGFAARLVFAAVQMAGEMADAQAAFAFAGVVAPETGERVSVIGQLQMAVAWLIFLGCRGDHMLIRGLADSLRAVPLGAGLPLTSSGLSAAVSALLVAAFQLAAPVVGACMLADLLLGLLTRAAPQMNLPAVGFPIKLAAGLMAAFLGLPLFGHQVRSLVSLMARILAAAAGGAAG